MLKFTSDIVNTKYMLTVTIIKQLCHLQVYSSYYVPQSNNTYEVKKVRLEQY